ncbi:DSBA-like thioredoxin domain-containing protein [Colletotrichum higginsianum IMI 349063]|uniref:DSBA-like thioredoxin domain-containing protein n=1 Tax=Colletotrichum higginsianum (strain IMI 349063) TaxID=759273 RepID=A0A1B7YQ92_COLHI|nr:DSBA-like thioredoxin domain-containing protein [Colletotrichum higginsianum IMI 349063]OBR14183.1 DSBA-like thioredoxin domain-containing protein [Colletotrichum higginsianum IMI 349063]
MGGKVDVYLDIEPGAPRSARGPDRVRCRSPFLPNAVTSPDTLAFISIHPVLLGAINAASGNKPPWALPAKAKYGDFDARRSTLRVGKPDITMPDNFMERSMTVRILRVLHVIKSSYPEAVYQTAWHWLLHCFWEPPTLNLTKPDVLDQALADTPAQYPQVGAGGRLFSEAEVRKILEGAATQEAKDAVKARTQEAIERGAFGAPWFWAVNDAGKGEPFFGSDRFHFLYDHLGVPYQDIAILPPQKSKL